MAVTNCLVVEVSRRRNVQVASTPGRILAIDKDFFTRRIQLNGGMFMKLKVIGLIAILFAVAVVAASQHPPVSGPQPQPAPPGQDPLAQNFFPPELVMQHRQALSLTEEQKAVIKDELLKASARFNDLQWQMQDEMETMVGLTKGANIDEQKVLAELDKILNIEREVKRTQLTLSIRLKNKLTSEQQTKLMEIQRSLHETAPRSPDR
jgi:Spy/CpxP family protein refolding chaperone